MLLRWSSTPAIERAKLLMKVADLLEERLDEFAELESEDQGKPVWLAKSIDIPRAVHNFRFFATNQLHVDNRSTFQEHFNALNYVSRQPVGVCALISPWNLPLYLLTWKIAPCLANGNTCVCKPSEFTSVTAFKLCEILHQAGLPAGVCNMVFGTGMSVGEPLVKHEDVRAVSFTGSTLVGARIQNLTSNGCKKLSLELGGKNAGIIFADCDLEKCVEITLKSSFINQGEICLCTSRLYIEESIYDEFVGKLVQGARRKMTVGDPKLASSKLGALCSEQHFKKVDSYVNLAKEEGGEILCGHLVDPRDPSLNENVISFLKNTFFMYLFLKGLFMAPTIIAGLTKGSKLEMEEIFGPVTCVWPFKTDDEVVDRANSVQYGLAATVWTKNVDRAHNIARRLEVTFGY